MVCHARDLQIPPGSGDEPNRYAIIESCTVLETQSFFRNVPLGVKLKFLWRQPIHIPRSLQSLGLVFYEIHVTISPYPKIYLRKEFISSTVHLQYIEDVFLLIFFTLLCNSYVKVYLRPDPQKETKRKTRVVGKNCHPSFMETVSAKSSFSISHWKRRRLWYTSAKWLGWHLKRIPPPPIKS